MTQPDWLRPEVVAAIEADGHLARVELEAHHAALQRLQQVTVEVTALGHQMARHEAARPRLGHFPSRQERRLAARWQEKADAYNAKRARLVAEAQRLEAQITRVAAVAEQRLHALGLEAPA